MNSSVKNQTAIVTGASSGYGTGIAESLANAGAKVWITGRNEERLNAVAEKIGATAFVADAGKSEDWDRLIQSVIEKTGRLDILVNNAGEGVKICPVAEQTDDSISQSLATNLTGAIFGCRRAAEIMQTQKSGLIINVGSVCAKHAWGEWAIYSAAKAGLLQFTKCLLTEMRPHGVKVTSVIPSWGQTSFTESAGLGPRGEVSEKCISPEDIGKLILQIAELPPHLVAEEITLWPMVQPMTQL